MGAGVSAGENNDDLIDNLMEADYIRTPSVVRVFRAVDRGAYFVSTHPQMNAYRDVAWKYENFHISAPCIYSEVMEGLKLEPGLSFLNLGSGTGYLSTMVGLVLGHNGINHGIELHGDVVQYANRKLEEFKRFSGAIDEFDFCEPKFVQGNCLNIVGGCQQYDRVYCGAACPETYLNYIKSFLKVGGILIIPVNEQLLEMTRTSETNWSARSLLPVSFANMIESIQGKSEMVKLPEVEPPTLQEICRATVRNILRKIIEGEHPPVERERVTKKKAPKKKRALRRFVVPLLDDDSDNETRIVVFRDSNRTDGGRAGFRSSPRKESKNEERNSMDIDSGTTTEDEQVKTEKVEAVIEHHSDEEEKQQPEEGEAAAGEINNTDESSLDVSEMQDVFVDLLTKFRRNVYSSRHQHQQQQHQHQQQHSDSEDGETAAADQQPTTSNGNGTANKKNNRREKFDSGLGDEIVEATTPTDNQSDGEDFLVSSSTEDEEQEGKRMKKSKNKGEKRIGCKWRKTDKNVNIKHGNGNKNNNNSGVCKSSSDEECENPKDQLKMYKSLYSESMKKRISELPLPTILKSYLNFYREF